MSLLTTFKVGQSSIMEISNGNFCSDGNAVHLTHECSNFKQFDLQDRPSSFVVHNGGWVVYEKPNYKGKCLYQHDGDCFSSNPANKGLKLKSWHSPIGSIRPMVGPGLQVLTLRVELDWSSPTKEITTHTLDSVHCRNSTFQYADPDWETVQTFEVAVNHR